jgi:hypothetical protein
VSTIASRLKCLLHPLPCPAHGVSIFSLAASQHQPIPFLVHLPHVNHTSTSPSPLPPTYQHTRTHCRKTPWTIAFNHDRLTHTHIYSPQMTRGAPCRRPCGSMQATLQTLCAAHGSWCVRSTKGRRAQANKPLAVFLDAGVRPCGLAFGRQVRLQD